MRIYHGTRLARGAARVIVFDGQVRIGKLNPRLDLRNHSPTGFEWGYSGSGPAQLALAILADHLAHTPADALRAPLDEEGPWRSRSLADRAALGLHQSFKAKIIAGIEADAFELSSAEISAALASIQNKG